MNLRLNRLLVNFKFQVQALTHILYLIRQIKQLLLVKELPLIDVRVNERLKSLDNIFSEKVHNVRQFLSAYVALVRATTVVILVWSMSLLAILNFSWTSTATIGITLYFVHLHSIISPRLFFNLDVMFSFRWHCWWGQLSSSSINPS